jgi:predicted MPP superfamily phosphohydrolase
MVLAALFLAALVQGLWWRALAGDGPAGAVVALYFGFALADGAMLAWLPRRGKSFGPPTPPLLALSALRWGLDAGFGLLTLAGLPAAWLLLVALALNATATLLATYATWVEPFRLGVTRLTLTTDRLPAGTRLRLVQLSDVHMERTTARDREVLQWVQDLAPDLILLTGDFLNLSYVGEPTAMEHFRAWANQLEARAGIFAVQGTPPVDPDRLMESLFDGLPVRLLRDEHVTLPVGEDGQLVIAGVGAGMTLDEDRARFQRTFADLPRDGFLLLLYHLPDLMPEAAAEGVDLYLAGHTHGGQIRLPLFGAVITSSAYWKRYEMGLFREGRTTLYVSRGLGMEGMAAPRARFLCPPEIVCVDVEGLAAVREVGP